MTTFFVAVLLASLGAGTVGAVLGLGGGILLVPILTIFFGGICTTRWAPASSR